MSYYGGSVTVGGRELITRLIAGETIEFTRVLVGSGRMPDGVEPIDMTGLVKPIAEATSTVPMVENGVLSMIVEYRNDMNGGLEEGFWLSEFAIYAKTETAPERCIYYATLGDSPQPVNAYKDNRVDSRRYPITIALEVDADIQVGYTPSAFLTSEDAEEMVTAMLAKVDAAIIAEIVIPAEGWREQEEDDDLVIDVPCKDARESHFPNISLNLQSIEVAEQAGLRPTIQALDGIVRLWAERAPEQDISGTLALMSTHPSVGNDNEGSGHTIPVATRTTLGGIKVQDGSGLVVDREGNLSIATATDKDAEDVYDMVNSAEEP